VTLAAVLSFMPGCTDSPPTERRLVPFLNERGLISYQYEDEIPEPTPPPAAVVAARRAQFFGGGGRGDDQAYREMIEYRRRQQERMDREQQERLSAQAQTSGMLGYQRELGRLQQRAIQERDSEDFHRRREQVARGHEEWMKQQLEEQARWLRLQQHP
jgi:hypothetical protein